VVVSGIDVGSITTEAVVVDGEGVIRAYSILETGADPKKTAEDALLLALEKCSRQRGELSYVVSTGYGRKRVSFTNEVVTEITCIAKGANFLFPNARTIIDIGGQDTKVIRTDGKGRVVAFEMNDKCAAGTGRFLEVMAKALNVGLESIGELSLLHKKELTISSICTVFAESEVISLLSEGEELEDILYGIHKAVADRTVGLISRLGGIEGEVVMAGGVAKNVGVVKVLEQELKVPIKVFEEPQIVAAFGAALIGMERVGNGRSQAS